MKRILLSLIFFTSLCFVSGQNLVQEYVILIDNGMKKSDYDQSLKICNKLINYQPAFYYAYYLRGLNYYLMEDYEMALDDFDQSIKLNSDFSDAYIQRAKTKSKLNNLLGAMADYNRVRNEKFYESVSSLAGDVLWSVFSGRKKNVKQN